MSKDILADDNLKKKKANDFEVERLLSNISSTINGIIANSSDSFPYMKNINDAVLYGHLKKIDELLILLKNGIHYEILTIELSSLIYRGLFETCGYLYYMIEPENRVEKIDSWRAKNLKNFRDFYINAKRGTTDKSMLDKYAESYKYHLDVNEFSSTRIKNYKIPEELRSFSILNKRKNRSKDYLEKYSAPSKILHCDWVNMFNNFYSYNFEDKRIKFHSENKDNTKEYHAITLNIIKDISIILILFCRHVDADRHEKITGDLDSLYIQAKAMIEKKDTI